MQEKLYDIVSAQSGFHDGPFDITCVILYRDILLLPGIDTAPNGDSLAVPRPEKIQATSSSPSEKDSKTPPKHSSKSRKTSMMRTRFDAAKEF